MYDTYIVDHLKSARDSLYRLLVRYQVEQNREAAISRLDYTAELELPNHTSLFFLDIASQEKFHRSVENIRGKRAVFPMKGGQTVPGTGNIRFLQSKEGGTVGNIAIFPGGNRADSSGKGHGLPGIVGIQFSDAQLRSV